MANNSNPLNNLGGSIFWILIVMVALAGLMYLGIWSFHNNNVQGVAILAIFGVMILSGIILSNFEIFNSGTWTQNCFWFTIGFLIWAFWFGGQSKSVLSLTQNGLFASIAAQLPLSLEFTFNTYIIPIAEEIFWMIGLPYSLNAIMNLIGSKYAFVKNIVVKVSVIALVTMVSFAFFHVGKLLVAFLIGAMIFRLFMVLSVIAEPTVATKFKALRFLLIVPAFSLGAHVGNNWADTTQGPGLMGGVNVLVASPVIGVIVGVFFIVIFFSAGVFVKQLVSGRGFRG